MREVAGQRRGNTPLARVPAQPAVIALSGAVIDRIDQPCSAGKLRHLLNAAERDIEYGEQSVSAEES